MEYKKVIPKKIDDIHWEIPIGTIPNMNVPGLVIASEKQIEKMQQDRTLIQCAGVATLPGIYKHAITLPDGHEGYGFPIGGVAALDYKEGGISPGGIGYDINCLAGDSKILTEYGSYLNISNFDRTINISNNGNTLVLTSGLLIKSLGKKCIENKEIDIFMSRQTNEGELYKLKTACGLQIKATKDHPFLTPKGMIKLKDLKIGDLIAINTFEGVLHEEQQNFDILTDNDFNEVQATELKKRGLLPLTSKNKNLPIIAKLFGYILGDGTIYFSNKKGFVNFYGQKEDLEKIKEDLNKIGFSSGLYGREREHSIKTQYGTKDFKAINYELHCSSKSLTKYFEKLGMPIGTKTNKEYYVPQWVLNSKLWIKRLFLAALFGAELSTPRTHTKTGFDSPVLSMNKNKGYLNNGRKFLIQIMQMLESFNVKSTISERKEYMNRFGGTYRLRLTMSSNENNLLRLWRKIGFEYNKKRSLLADIACLYILLKKKENHKRADLSTKIRAYKENGLTLSEVKDLFRKHINERFIERHYYEKAGQRISLDFISFTEFLRKSSKIIEVYGTLFDNINEIIESANEKVYDFNVRDNHNFIANGFIVSNCGVRLVRTNFQKEEMRKHLPALLDAVFKNVPSGVGSKGKIKVNTQSDFDEVLRLGARWAVNKEFGWKEDLKHLEEEGCLEQADPSKVSEDAKKRGMPQLGSLGAGNHFLEVQYVDKIYQPDVAKKFGIEHEGQVMLMIHTGSRGCGHQICSDYLRLMEKEYHDLIAKLADRELVYAPSGSKMAEDYFAAMCAGANYAWCNRQMILHWIRQSFEDTFKQEAEKMGLNVVYDVCHNIAKVEEHEIDGKKTKVYVHRKGATRAFGPGRKEIPADYRSVGQPVIIPGSMGTASYVLVGTEHAMKESFGSTAHGAGREMSRNEALRRYTGEGIKKELEARNILIRAATKSVIAEEAPGAYKDIDEVARVSDKAGIGKMVARLVPMGVAKG